MYAELHHRYMFKYIVINYALYSEIVYFQDIIYYIPIKDLSELKKETIIVISEDSRAPVICL